MKLVIVESPTKSEAITRFLGDGYKVLASQGHIRDLSTKGKGGLGIDVDHGFKADWTIPDAKKRIVSTLKAEAKKADAVILATDPDREGEAISWHLAETLNLPIETTQRVTFEEITKDVVRESIAHPRTIDMNLVRAQEARRMEDRIVGFKLSSLLQRKVGIKSAGRVQSATLRMIVDRQNEIDDYEKNKKEYWTIDINVKLGSKTYKASLVRVDGEPISKKIDEFNKNATNISSKEMADALLSRIPDVLNVASVVTTHGNKTQPAMPFTTSTMQQAAYSKFGFSNARTQSIAQSLFEGKNSEHIGLITYMRTDSTRLSPHFFHTHAVPFITETFGEEYIGTLRQGGGAQDAHEAIRPTGTHRTPEVVAKFVSPEEAKLYRLIYCRAIASTMAPKVYDSTKVILEGNGLEFVLSGTKTVFKGYTAIYGEFEDKDEASLPELKEGDQAKLVSVKPEQKFTKANPPYNEASIVKAMEEKGIGRPSTYASTVDTLLKRKYVVAKKGVLSPTDDGKKCVEVLAEHFPDVVDTAYTAEMEAKLDKVSAGSLTFLDAMNEFYEDFMDTYNKGSAEIQKAPDEETGELCPVCGKPLVIKKSKTGKIFIGCSGFPECHYIKKEAPEFVGENCPECGAPLVYKVNKRGEKFVGCSNFPSCHYTRNQNGEPTKKAEKVTYTEEDYVKPCPKCGGHLVIKQGKRAKFLGCINFPKCRYHEWLDDKSKEK